MTAVPFLVAIRADAARGLGTGHVMRCIALADALAASGASVHFICREHDGNLCDFIEGRGFRVSRLAAPSASFIAGCEDSRARWLGATSDQDAEQTARALAGEHAPQWLIVDHYSLDESWERRLRAHARRILVIDDLANRRHDCDLLLDQNLVVGMESRYDDRVPATCARMLGPRYALLSPVYADLHDRVPARAGLVKRVLIFLGDSGPVNVTSLVLGSFLSLQRADIAADVVIARNSPHAADVRSLAAGHSNVHVHEDLPSLAPLMARADLALGGAGSTSWERLCLGLPTLVISLADNQRAIADGLHQNGLARWLGHFDEVTSEAVRAALQESIESGADTRMSHRAASVVDGRGTAAVIVAMQLDGSEKVDARNARVRDADFVVECAASGSTQPRSARDAAWFTDRLRNLDSSTVVVCETRRVPVGYVEFVRRADEWTMEACVAAPYRAGEFGQRIREAALLQLRVMEGGALQLAPSAPQGSPRRIAICTDRASWINAMLPQLILHWSDEGHFVSWTHDAAQLQEGDLCFYLSYGKVVPAHLRKRFRHNLVVHESDLPHGRGWSPLTWQILEGRDVIPVTLLEAADKVDSGTIYLRGEIRFVGTELVDELRAAQADGTFRLCLEFVRRYPEIVQEGIPQPADGTYYRRRTPADSSLDATKSLAEQFALLRVVDNERYPAWMEIRGARYELQIRRG